MLSDDYPFLLPARTIPDLSAKLRTLADDLERIKAGEAPTENQYAQAPLIREWKTVVDATGLRLAGVISGHPRIRAGVGMTSQVWAADPHGRWIRTLARFYRLGEGLENAAHETEPDDDVLDEELRDV